MAHTWVEYFKPQTAGTAGGDVTSDSISVAINDIVTVAWVVENNSSDAGGIQTPSISNTGTALSWQNIGNSGLIAGSGDSTYIQGWWAKATAAESITITTAGSGSGAYHASQSVVVHTGAHQTAPIVAGNVFSGRNATDVSQAITPKSSGSCLWGVFGDWAQTNTFAAIANCTIESSQDDAGKYTAVVIRPTTQPRTDWSAFTLGETDTSGDIAYLIWEVRAPAPDFFGSARNPADAGAAVGPPCSITPPANMLAGDLCIVHVGARNTAVWDFSNSTAAGQSWNTAGEFDSTNNAKQATFWCRFNGTWVGTPAFTNNGAIAMWAEMQVFRPSNSNNTWAVDQAYAGANFAAPSTPFTVTRTGVTNVQASTVTVATILSQDDNTYGSLSGAGWATYTPIYSRVGTTASHAHTYRIGGAGATGNVSLNQATLGGDAGSTSIVSFYEQTAAVSGNLIVTEGSDVLAASGEKTFHGSAGATEGFDIGAFSGTLIPKFHTGDAAAIEGLDIFAATGDAFFPSMSGYLEVMEALDVLAASGEKTFHGNAGLAEASDAGAFSGTLIPKFHEGTLAALEALDALAASGDISVPGAITGYLDALEALDALAATGAKTFHGGLAVAEALDALAASGSLIPSFIVGAFAGLETLDVVEMAGEAYNPSATFGSAAMAETADSAAFSGSKTFVGAIAALEPHDVAASQGSMVVNFITGALAIEEIPDAFFASDSMEMDMGIGTRDSNIGIGISPNEPWREGAPSWGRDGSDPKTAFPGVIGAGPQGDNFSNNQTSRRAKLVQAHIFVPSGQDIEPGWYTNHDTQAGDWAWCVHRTWIQNDSDNPLGQPSLVGQIDTGAAIVETPDKPAFAGTVTHPE